MSNFFKDNDDLRYYFERGLDWDEIVRINELNGPEAAGFRATPRSSSSTSRWRR